MFLLFDVYRRRNHAPTLGLFDEAHRDCRVGLTDIDLNLHLNNARYLRYMDLARLEHFVATGTLYRLMRDRTNPIVAGTEISYLRELRTFARFRVSARVVGYDERYLYYAQRFESGGRITTQAFIRIACVKGGRARPMAEIVDLLGLPPSPELPPPVEAWRAMVKETRRLSAGISAAATTSAPAPPAPR